MLSIDIYTPNLNGDLTSGGWQAQQPLSEIICDSIVDGLKMAELDVVSEGSALALSGELVNLDYKIITGFWKGQLNSEMTVKLELKRTSDGEILWRETDFSKDRTDRFEIEKYFSKAACRSRDADHRRRPLPTDPPNSPPEPNTLYL